MSDRPKNEVLSTWRVTGSHAKLFCRSFTGNEERGIENYTRKFTSRTRILTIHNFLLRVSLHDLFIFIINIDFLKNKTRKTFLQLNLDIVGTGHSTVNYYAYYLNAWYTLYPIKWIIEFCCDRNFISRCRYRCCCP